MNKKLKVFGVDKVSVNETEMTIVGKGHPELWKLVELDGSETIEDFEGIDDESKKIGHTFPINKVNKIWEAAFGYMGKLIKMSEEEVLFIRKDSMNEELNDIISEQIEAAMMLIDINDDKDIIIETAFDAFIGIATTIGNTNLQCELENAKLDIMI